MFALKLLKFGQCSAGQLFILKTDNLNGYARSGYNFNETIIVSFWAIAV